MGCSKEVCVIGIVCMFLIVIAYGFVQDPGCDKDCHKKAFKNFAFIAVLVIGCIAKFSKSCGYSGCEEGSNSNCGNSRRQATVSTQNSQLNPGMPQVVPFNRIRETPADNSFVSHPPSGNPFIIGNYMKERKNDCPPQYDPPPDYNECQSSLQQSRQNLMQKF